MIAIVLIIIIVLKTRTRVDENFKVTKVEDTRTYHFNNPPGGSAHNGEFDPLPPGSLGGTLPSTGGGIVSATVIRPTNPSALDGGTNGFYTKGAGPVTATVKKNGNKPIREWYV